MTGIDAMRSWTQPLSPAEHGRRLGAFGSFGDSLSYWEWQDILLASTALALLVGLWALLACRDQLHKVRRCCRCRSRYPPPPERAAESAYELSATRDAEWEELDNGQGERYWHHRLTGMLLPPFKVALVATSARAVRIAAVRDVLRQHDARRPVPPLHHIVTSRRGPHEDGGSLWPRSVRSDAAVHNVRDVIVHPIRG